MTTHLTVRLAWHDNKWNGTICKNPTENAYCVGSHSLLSERIARDRDLEKESAKPCHKLDVLMPDYLPPCFWSSCAFSDDQTEVVHAHPFSNFRQTKRISQTLPESSVYTWPFRLSITHGRSAQNKHGQYPADLDDRVDNFVGRLTPDKSLVFFYLNYDNPVSADEYRYALVGCARISDLERSGEYQFTNDELKQLRDSPKTRNFPTRNWAIRVSYSFRETGVLLPYHEYLDYVAEHPEDEDKLDSIKVLIEEPTLLTGFKYVSEQVNNDSCLYLLYKMRKAFETVEEHGIVPVTDEIARIDSYIAEFWNARGLYPGLPAVVGVLGAFRDGDPDWESADDCGLVQAVRGHVGSEEEVLSTVFSELHSKGKLEYLNIAQQKVLRQARRAIDAAPHLNPILQRLSLFNLTPRQITRIVWPDLADGRKEAHPFGQRQITRDEITANPYLLCEDYKPFPKNELDNSSELDRELRTDGPIDYFTIDIGMFPDEDRYDCWDDNLLTLSSTGPERLRAFAVQSLRKQQDSGNTYLSLEELLENIGRHPLFYRKQFAVDREQVLSEKCRQHFRKRLRDVEVGAEVFFYLEETKQAEEHVERFVQLLVGLQDHKTDLTWVDEHLSIEAKKLSKLPNFDEKQFIQERTQLIRGIFTQRLFLVTGRPGSGKTRALREIVNGLIKDKQKVVILTPTGKAALRVRSEETGATVETIDRWINRCGLRRYVDDLSQLSAMQRSNYYDPVENLIIDETSMVDLAKLAVVCRAIEVHEPQIKRIILVGDENQLPPIGMGRPLYDILQWLGTDADRFGRHVVRLRSNCRQQQDRVVVDAAYLFAGKNRYHTELWGKMQNGEPISEHLNVVYWE